MAYKPLSAAEAYPLLASASPPSGLRVSGVLDYSDKSDRPPPARLPDDLVVDVLDLSGSEIECLPRRLKCYELKLARTPIRSLPNCLKVESRIDLTGCDRLESLPADLTTGTLVLRACTALTALPERLDVWFLDLTGCWAF